MSTKSLNPVNQIGAKRTVRGGVPQKYILSPEGYKLLKDRYDGSRERTAELSEQLNVPRRMIREWARKMEIAGRADRLWTLKETKYLHRYISEKTFQEIGDHIGRTQAAVRVKAHKLGLLRERDGYTMKDLSDGLGCSSRKVTQWIDSGWLKGIRRETGVWDFSDKQICDFLKNHPLEIDLSQVDQLWFMALVFDLGRMDSPCKADYTEP